MVALALLLFPTSGFRLPRFLKCLETESNRRHEDFQSSALPTELSRRLNSEKETGMQKSVFPRSGFPLPRS